jgi:Flp pilus assembly protein TadG
MRRLFRDTLLKKSLRDTRAVAAVEFAFGGIVLIAMILVILDLGDLALVLGAMTYSTQLTAREAAVGTGANLAQSATSASCTTQAQILTMFNSAMPSLLPAATSSGNGTGAPLVLASWVQVAGVGTTLQIITSYNWVPPGMPPGLRGLKVPLSVTETQMVEGTSGTVTQQCS